jgi:hypothetical protein
MATNYGFVVIDPDIEAKYHKEEKPTDTNKPPIQTHNWGFVVVDTDVEMKYSDEEKPITTKK